MSKIKELRLEHGWTQEDLGKKLNVQKSAISKYEKGIVTPSGDVLKMLSAIFGVSTDYLLDNENASRTPVYHLSRKHEDLINGFDDLNDDGQNTLMKVLAGLRATFPARVPV